jgi:hypothetical protein
MRHLVIPDSQIKPGVPVDHLEWAGEYAVKKKPDVIVNIGDGFDLPSLSMYDIGKKSFEGRTYQADIKAGKSGIEAFLRPIWKEQERLRRNKEKIWKPRLVYTLGNHEYRIERAIELDRKLEGLMSFKDLGLEEYGFEVIPYLEPISIDGVLYCHYFTSGVMGRPVVSARSLMTKKMMSCVQGHLQPRDIAYGRRGDGSSITCLMAGIFYQHDEDYLTPQTNADWRGIWMLNEVSNGSFDELPVSLNYLRECYSGAKES